MTQSTRKRMRQIEALCNAATPGPWEYVDYRAIDGTGILRQVGKKRGFLGIVHNNGGEFLAQAREAIPWLVNELRNTEARRHDDGD